MIETDMKLRIEQVRRNIESNRKDAEKLRATGLWKNVVQAEIDEARAGGMELALQTLGLTAHRATITSEGDVFVAECSCGWCSDGFDTKNEAKADHAEHVLSERLR